MSYFAIFQLVAFRIYEQIFKDKMKLKSLKGFGIAIKSLTFAYFSKKNKSR